MGLKDSVRVGAVRGLTVQQIVSRNRSSRAVAVTVHGGNITGRDWTLGNHARRYAPDAAPARARVGRLGEHQRRLALRLYSRRPRLQTYRSDAGVKPSAVPRVVESFI